MAEDVDRDPEDKFWFEGWVVDPVSNQLDTTLSVMVPYLRPRSMKISETDTKADRIGVADSYHQQQPKRSIDRSYTDENPIRLPPMDLLESAIRNKRSRESRNQRRHVHFEDDSPKVTFRPGFEPENQMSRRKIEPNLSLPPPRRDLSHQYQRELDSSEFRLPPPHPRNQSYTQNSESSYTEAGSWSRSQPTDLVNNTGQDSIQRDFNPVEDIKFDPMVSRMPHPHGSPQLDRSGIPYISESNILRSPTYEDEFVAVNERVNTSPYSPVDRHVSPIPSDEGMVSNPSENQVIHAAQLNNSAYDQPMHQNTPHRDYLVNSGYYNRNNRQLPSQQVYSSQMNPRNPPFSEGPGTLSYSPYTEGSEKWDRSAEFNRCQETTKNVDNLLSGIVSSK